jgi:hypothetical protein
MVAALAGVQVLVFRGHPGLPTPAPWATVAAAILASASAFVLGRWQFNYLWGIVLALLVPLHPVFRTSAQTYEPALLGESLVLFALACLIGAWRLTFLPRFAWRSWILAAVGLVGALTLAWPVQPRAGLEAAVLTGGGLLLAFLTGLRRRGRRPVPTPSGWNLSAAAALALLAPEAGLLLAPHTGPLLGRYLDPAPLAADDWQVYWRAAVTLPDSQDFHLQGFTAADLQVWAWPLAWVVLPLMLWGWWRSFRRGWKQSARRQPPVGWMITFFAAVHLAFAAVPSPGGREGTLLALAVLAVLLVVFWLADLVRGITERLVLAPPHERDFEG